MGNQTRPARELKLLFTATALSWIGNWLTSLVIFQWIFQVTKSPWYVGVAIAVHRLPMMVGALFLAPVAGIIPAKLRASLDSVRALILGGMAIIVWVTPTGSLEPGWEVWLFLALAGLRSLFSGVDGSTESSIISLEASSDRVRAARNQQTLAILSGISGFVASAVFTLGILSFSYSIVLVFDLLTFGISGCAFYLARSFDSKIEKKLPVSSSVSAMVDAAFRYPPVTILSVTHLVRMVGISVALQQWLLLFQVKFHMGPWSAGYLYMTYTLALFISSQLVKKTNWRPSISAFISLSAIVCFLAPFGWLMDSKLALIILTFAISLIEGSLLTSIGSEFQITTKNSDISNVFGGLVIWTQVGIVGGSLLVGTITNKSGFHEGSLIIGCVSGFILILILAVYKLGEPLIEWFWHFCHLKIKGVKLKINYVSYESLEAFLGVTNRNEKQLICSESSIVANYKDRALYSGSIVFGGEKSENEWKSLTLAMYETIERLGGVRYYESLNEPLPLPTSNGFAVHSVPSQAELKSREEIIERDSILAHYYHQKPAVFQIDSRVLILENSIPALVGSEIFDECKFYRFSTGDRDYRAVMCIAKLNGEFSIGWGISSGDCAVAITKSFSEAFSSYRFHQIEFLKPLRERMKTGNINPQNKKEFLDLVSELSINPSDLQMALVLVHPKSKLRLEFLTNSQNALSYDEFNAEIDSTQWLSKLEVESDFIEDNILGNLTLSRAYSPSAFVLEWPGSSAEKLIEISKQRFLDKTHQDPTDNFFGPCLYY